MDVEQARGLLVRGNGVPRRPDKVERALSEALEEVERLRAHIREMAWQWDNDAKAVRTLQQEAATLRERVAELANLAVRFPRSPARSSVTELRRLAGAVLVGSEGKGR